MNNNFQNFEERVQYLKEKAKEVRVNIIDMIFIAQSGHPGGALSAADLMTALYFDILKIDPKNPHWPDRDRLILSKGHACPVWYSCLAMRGYFPMKELKTLRKFESILQGHPDMRKTPGIDMTTGSLGQGLSLGVGMALEGKLVKKNYHIYVILGDGEINEGQVWEAAASASKYKLDNLTAIIDKNGLQMDGFTDKVMPMDPIDKKFEAFNWQVMTINGHDMKEILITLEKAKKNKNKPVCIIANTIKGKGVSFMENIRKWHGKAPNQHEYEIAIKEIEESNDEIK
jgi:transketolase